MAQRLIDASDLGTWTYCNRQWFLSEVIGLTPDREAQERLAEGTRIHQRHGRQAATSSLLIRAAFTLFLLAALAIALLFLNAATFAQEIPRSLRTLSLFQVIAFALGAAVIALVLRRISLRLDAATGLPENAVIAYGDTGRHKVMLMRDAKVGLIGKPDAILQVRRLMRTRYIPAELKSTRGALRVYDGQRLQLLAYIHLMQREFGAKAEAYGYILLTARGPEGIIRVVGNERVDLDSATREWLLRTVAAIQGALPAKDVHRNHHQVRRCERCTFSKQCSESLAKP